MGPGGLALDRVTVDRAEVIATADGGIVAVRGWRAPGSWREALALQAREQHRTGELGKRGDVRAVMSSDVRRRLLLAMADASGWLAWGTTVALTYGADGASPERFKRDLDVLGKRMRRSCWGGLVAGLWVLEFQRRGAAHGHLVAGGRSADELVRWAEWLRGAWLDITGEGGSGRWARERYGVLAVPVYLYGGLVPYFAKLLGEAGKVSQKHAPEGRPGKWWGHLDREAFGALCEAYPAVRWELREPGHVIRERLIEVGRLLWPNRQPVWCEGLGEAVRWWPGLLVGEAAAFVATGDRSHLVAILDRRGAAGAVREAVTA